MELTVVFACNALDVVEAVAPVEAEQAEHRQIDAHTETSRTLHIERVEVLKAKPAVTSLKEGQRIDGGLRVKRQRIAQFKGVFREHVATSCASVVVTRCKRIVAITTHTHQLAAIKRIVVQAIATEEITMEWGRANLRVEVTEIAKAHTGHQHKFLIKFGIPSSFEGPTVHLHPFVLLVFREGAVILVGKERIRRRDFQAQHELGTTARIERLAHRIAAQRDAVTDQVELAIAIANIEKSRGIIRQIVSDKTETLIHRKIVIRPRQTTAQACRQTCTAEPTIVFIVTVKSVGIERLIE